jgi:large subunit ribosomal protein L29
MKENADKARALDTAEIEKQLRESAEQMFRLRFQMSMGQMEGLKKVRLLKKDRARMLTVLRDRELHPDTAAIGQATAKAEVKAAAKVKATKAKTTQAKTISKAAPKSASKSTSAVTAKAKPRAAAKATSGPRSTNRGKG